jgi:hypothetical protein
MTLTCNEREFKDFMAACGYPDGNAPAGYQNEDPVMVTLAYERRFREFMSALSPEGRRSWGR